MQSWSDGVDMPAQHPCQSCALPVPGLAAAQRYARQLWRWSCPSFVYIFSYALALSLQECAAKSPACALGARRIHTHTHIHGAARRRTVTAPTFACARTHSIGRAAAIGGCGHERVSAGYEIDSNDAENFENSIDHHHYMHVQQL